MRVTSNISYILALHPDLQTEAQSLIEQAEISILPPNMGIAITCGLRTVDEQNTLYAQGRTKPGPIVTNAKGGYSFHAYGLAIDFCWAYQSITGKYVVSDKTAWAVGPLHKKTRMFFVNHGWESGANWKTLKDYPHLEKRFGYPEDCAILYQKYLNKDFINNIPPYLNL